MTVGVRPVDFLCIGAAKCGTTSLFEYLRTHPRIRMPPTKEAPFATDDKAWETGWPSFYAKHFAGSPDYALLGKITPQYMADPRAPERIAATFPCVRIVALLRDPVERAHSDWRMRVRTGMEDRSFADAVAEQLRPEALERARSREQGDGASPRDLYLARGEYGRILTRWFERFGPEQRHVEFSERLASSTAEAMADVARFLGIENDFSADRLGKKHHRAGDRERFPGLLRRLSGNPLARGLWRLVSYERRLDWLRWFNWNVRYRREARPIPAATRQRLVDFFRDDVARLEELIGRAVPWHGHGRGTGG